jgi:cell wall-associated NlpC family hydrolase
MRHLSTALYIEKISGKTYHFIRISFRRFPMTKAVIAALLAVLSPALACAAPQAEAPSAAVVLSTVENMHSGPSADTDVVSQALLGDTVKVLKREKSPEGAEWARIATPDTYEGWVAAKSLRVLEPGAKPYASSGKVFVVSSLLANTYRETDVTKHKPLKVAPISAVLEVVAEKSDRWLEIVLPCGHQAFVQRGDGDLREAPWTWPRLSVEDAIALSKRFLGLPYTWGGTSPFGLDCSGFVQLVYKMSGVPILRDADIQMTKSGLAEVPKGQEKPGDLIFFGRSIDRISHVGMMIEGGLFINATVHEHPVVRIDDLREAYWQGIYQAARRPSERSER